MTTTLPDAKYWRATADGATRPTQAFIGGNYVDAVSEETFEVVDPSTGRLLARVAASGVDDVDAAVSAGRSAFEQGTWSRMAPRARGAVLGRLAAGLIERREEIAALLTLEVGKPITTALGEVDGATQAFAFYGEAVDKVYGEIAPTDSASLALITREPMGVVAAVTPWNYPLLMATWKVAPALAAGNSVVLKPAEQAPLATLLLGELSAAAGLPPGALSVLPGVGEVTGRALGLHHGVDAVTFTGSTEVGKLFLVYAGQSNMKSVSLECGGKSPNIVLADAENLELAAEAAAAAIYSNAGENCNAGSRLLVERSIHDDFLEAVVRAAGDWMPADPFDPATRMGALVDEQHMGRVRGYIARGVADGARLSAGGRPTLTESGGYFLEPTVFSDVEASMTIAQEEIFGPVLAAMPFDDLEHAIRLANGTSFGLAAGVWTRDVRTAHRLARELRAGVIYVNCYDRGDLSVPFGGFDQSGIGVDKSLMALEKYRNVKATWLDVARS